MALLGPEYASDGDFSDEDPNHTQLRGGLVIRPTETSLSYNISQANYSLAEQGPANPFKSNEGNALKRKNVLTGFAEEASLSSSTFNTQHRTFQSRGYAADPSANGGFVGDISSAQKYGGKDFIQLRPSKEESRSLRAKRQKRGDASITDGEHAYQGPWARWQGDDQAYEDEAALAGEELASDEEWVEEAIVPTKADPLPQTSTDYTPDLATTETTEFHGSALYDYQGRTYMHVPQDLDIDLRGDAPTKNFIPKKHIHTWKGHTKAITALRFFPNSAHLLLSSSADCTVKLWDVYHSRELLRTYSGHTKSVSDINFDSNGKRFLSASYDRQIKLWDTETGQCISRFSTGKIPHVIKFHPESHEFLAGMSDKKIVQFDVRSGELTQEYDHHLGPYVTLSPLAFSRSKY